MQIIGRYYLGYKGPKIVVFILSGGRDGSNLLVSYLNSIPKVHIVGEVLNPGLIHGIRERFITKGAVIRHIAYSLTNIDFPVGGVKLLVRQLQRRSISYDELHKRFPDARYIVLYRESLTDKYVSSCMAFKTNQWTLRRGEKRHECTVDIHIEDFLQYAQDFRNCYTTLLSRPWLKESAVIFSYEELVANPQKVFSEKIFPFLRLSRIEVSTSMVKQRVRPLSEVVQNFDEVREVLLGPETRQYYTLE
jgi:LPS sulfotransferase NodH